MRVFSKRFLRPLLKGIEQIQKQEHKNAESEFVEIDDLFAFLAEQDRIKDEETEKLRTQCNEQGFSLEQKQADIDRLAYSRKNEVSPDDYEMFKTGLKTLTKTENKSSACISKANPQTKLWKFATYNKARSNITTTTF